MLSATRAVELNGGIGKLAIACTRKNIPCIVFARNQAHIEVMKETMEATIISENIDGLDKGLLSKRFLSRARSLGKESAGSDAGGSEIAPAAAAASAAADAAEPAAAAAQSGSCSSDSE